MSAMVLATAVKPSAAGVTVTVVVAEELVAPVAANWKLSSVVLATAGAMKLAVAVSALTSVTAGPPVWVQATLPRLTDRRRCPSG